jgi:hypothetical protein
MSTTKPDSSLLTSRPGTMWFAHLLYMYVTAHTRSLRRQFGGGVATNLAPAASGQSGVLTRSCGTYARGQQLHALLPIVVPSALHCSP